MKKPNTATTKNQLEAKDARVTKVIRNWSLGAIVGFVANLCALPVMAQSVTVDATIQPKVLICLNNSTGNTVLKEGASAGPGDCSDLPQSPGDEISIIVSGVSGGVDPGPCNPVQEQEPNDWSHFQELGTLENGACVEIAGNIAVGVGDPNNPDPNSDFDGYRITVTGSTTLNVSFQGDANAGFVWGIGNPNTGEIVDCTGTPNNCQVPVTDVGDLLVAAINPGNYKVRVAVGAGATTSTEHTRYSSDIYNLQQRFYNK
jgi:hypothetical protein